MSTAINGAATEAAMNTLNGASRTAGKSVASAAAAVGPAVESVGSTTRQTGQIWVDASRTFAGLSLDAYDAGVATYLEYASTVAAAGRADWALELAENNAKLFAGIATNYSTAARDILGA